MPVFVDIDPRTLHLPTSARHGADPVKLQRQMARFGVSTVGMYPPWVYRGSDGALVIFNGVTRAIRVEIIGDLKIPVGHYPTVGDHLP